MFQLWYNEDDLNDSKRRNIVLNHVIRTTIAYLDSMPKTKRKKIGQFFTSLETARFMAGLFVIPEQKHLDVLDPGTGSAILTAALMERLSRYSELKSVSLICYETEPAILPLLRDNLDYLKDNVPFKLNYTIISKNYITNQQNPKPIADLVIGNPPYLKVNRQAPEACAMPQVIHGAPNLYFLFAARSIENLRDRGQMVYIIPRSWTSGAYFKAFRHFLFGNTALEHMHLFVSRDKVFEQESVLQETMIIKIQKAVPMPQSIRITSTETTHDFQKMQIQVVPSKLVVKQDENQYVYLVTNPADVDTLECLSILPHTLPDLQMKMKTGLTVDFRERGHLFDVPAKDRVPMFFSQHLKDGRIVFPVGKHGEFLDTRKRSLLQPNENYLFVKRFTAKEEPRRLQSSIYLQADFSQYQEISTQNKLNFITGIKKPLSTFLVYGLYCLFNSTLYDRYYRILNGSTQVNSTEVNTMPMPSRDGIEHLGQRLMETEKLDEATCDYILEEYLNGENRRSEKIS